MKGQPALLTLTMALLTSCQSPTMDKPAKAAVQESAAGRYQILATPTKTLKLDTVTGQTWYLDDRGAWVALPQNTSGGSTSKTNEPYNTFEVIATKAPLSIFELPEEKRPKLVEDLIRAIPGVVSVKRVDPNDPLGLFAPPSADKKTRP